MTRIKTKPRKILGDGKTTKKITTGSVRRPRRFRPGTVALREIRKYQKSTELLIKKIPFQRLVREVVYTLDKTKTYRITPQALLALHEAAEDFLVTMFGQVNDLAIHGNRVTVYCKDIHIWKRLMNY